PVFKMPSRPVREKEAVPIPEPVPDEEEPVVKGKAKKGAKLFVDESFNPGKGNILKEEGGVVAIGPPPSHPVEEPIEFTVTEREEEVPEVLQHVLAVEEDENEDAPAEEPPPPLVIPPIHRAATGSLELEIKTPEPQESPAEDSLLPENLPDYEPTLDLRDYKYPTLDLLEAHGSEKIVQDPSELEANKNQILSTLKNYDISISKISATVGPTVTLYEIVPAAGVRISRIKNLEDDIALSLAALGIRIIAPIPGKGTIGIEVPNVKKTVVSMRTLLSSD